MFPQFCDLVSEVLLNEYAPNERRVFSFISVSHISLSGSSLQLSLLAAVVPTPVCASD